MFFNSLNSGEVVCRGRGKSMGTIAFTVPGAVGHDVTMRSER